MQDFLASKRPQKPTYRHFLDRKPTSIRILVSVPFSSLEKGQLTRGPCSFYEQGPFTRIVKSPRYRPHLYSKRFLHTFFCTQKQGGEASTIKMNGAKIPDPYLPNPKFVDAPLSVIAPPLFSLLQDQEQVSFDIFYWIH